MARIPNKLEQIQKELKAEVEIWNSLGMSLDNTLHSAASVFYLKMQIQTIINLMLEKELVSNEEFNAEFKKLVLGEMQEMREQHEPAIKEARRQAIVGGARPDIAVPRLRLLGPDGKEMEL